MDIKRSRRIIKQLRIFTLDTLGYKRVVGKRAFILYVSKLFVSFKWWACSCVSLLLKRHLLPDSYNFISSLHPYHQNHQKWLGVQGLRTMWFKWGKKEKKRTNPDSKLLLGRTSAAARRGFDKLLDQLTEIKKTPYLPIYFKGYNQLPHAEVHREARRPGRCRDPQHRNFKVHSVGVYHPPSTST